MLLAPCVLLTRLPSGPEPSIPGWVFTFHQLLLLTYTPAGPVSGWPLCLEYTLPQFLGQLPPVWVELQLASLEA